MHQLIYMRVKPLLAFIDTPNSNAVPDESFNDERRFIVAAAEPVKHEHE
jgi:hypothetical protein